MEEDRELKLITARKMAELKKRMEKTSVAKEEKPSKELVSGMLYDRGDEVLDTAYRAYPKETQVVVDQIAKLIKGNKLAEKISGGELYSIFRTLGMRFSLNTSIKVQEKGRFVDLAEKLRRREEE